jgi:hypothetical protein
MQWKLILPGILALPVAACAHRLQRGVVTPEQSATVDHAAPFLKVHMRDGNLYVLSPWQLAADERRVRGYGTEYGVDRKAIEHRSFDLSFDSVALFETNVVRPSPSVGALAVITGITAGVAVYCATNPKACFGSCPTFYASDGSRQILQAEGFSASIAPSLEATDVDALYRAHASGRDLRIEMRNEAYETHVVRHVDLLAVPRRPGSRVVTDLTGGFWAVTEPTPPLACTAAEGDCRRPLAAFDGTERYSAADSLDLGARETVELAFARPPSGRPALILASRQSLLPTYLLYQAFAYLGRSTGDWMAALDRADPAIKDRVAGVVGALGGIDVWVQNTQGTWDSVATVHETGPLAADAHLIPLPPARDTVRVRLRLAKGAWRLDFVGLGAMVAPVEPRRVQPAHVLGTHGDDPAARRRLTDPDSALVTLPGDRYTLVYHLPARASTLEIFLESRGYYLEWMRQEWMAEENPILAAALFLDPAGMLRRLAPDFKRVEPELERAFWGSKYAGF